eukprot:4463247-Pleurochrysis_carterae.AAC.1
MGQCMLARVFTITLDLGVLEAFSAAVPSVCRDTDGDGRRRERRRRRRRCLIPDGTAAAAGECSSWQAWGRCHGVGRVCTATDAAACPDGCTSVVGWPRVRLRT